LFKELQRELKKLERLKRISIPIDLDEKGYIDRQCPDEECEFVFKIYADDWEEIEDDAPVWCPLCRCEAPMDHWYTSEQVEHGKAEAKTVLEGKISEAMRKGARSGNRQSKNNFISVSFKVTGSRKRTYALPAKAADAMQLEIKCDNCQSRFAVIGNAYFCPACGHNSVTRTFSDSLRKIRAKVDHLDVVRDALIESIGKDEAELTCRSLIETSISDGVVAFQKYCEGMYEPFGTPPFNAFQRLHQASELWKDKIGEDFNDWLTTTESIDLNTLYQKRHLLQHNEGIVDDKYLQKSQDDRYKVGQRIVVQERDIGALIRILEKLSKGIEQAVIRSS